MVSVYGLRVQGLGFWVYGFGFVGEMGIYRKGNI